MEFLYFGIQRSHGHGHDVRVGPMMMVVGDLGHHHHERPAFVVGAQSVGQAYLGLVKAVGATLPGSVQKQDDRPLLLGGPVHRQINNIVVDGAIEGDGAVQKTGVLLAGVGVRRQHRDHAEEHTGEQISQPNEPHGAVSRNET